MSRDVTVTFDSGPDHVYNGVPDDATPDQITARAKKDFPKLKITHLDGGRPSKEEPKDSRSYVDRVTDAAKAASKANAIPKEDPKLSLEENNKRMANAQGDSMIGAAETVGSAITGLLAPIGGAIEAVVGDEGTAKERYDKTKANIQSKVPMNEQAKADSALLGEAMKPVSAVVDVPGKLVEKGAELVGVSEEHAQLAHEVITDALNLYTMRSGGKAAVKVIETGERAIQAVKNDIPMAVPKEGRGRFNDGVDAAQAAAKRAGVELTKGQLQAAGMRAAGQSVEASAHLDRENALASTHPEIANHYTEQASALNDRFNDLINEDKQPKGEAPIDTDTIREIRNESIMRNEHGDVTGINANKLQISIEQHAGKLNDFESNKLSDILQTAKTIRVAPKTAAELASKENSIGRLAVQAWNFVGKKLGLPVKGVIGYEVAAKSLEAIGIDPASAQLFAIAAAGANTGGRILAGRIKDWFKDKKAEDFKNTGKLEANVKNQRLAEDEVSIRRAMALQVVKRVAQKETPKTEAPPAPAPKTEAPPAPVSVQNLKPTPEAPVEAQPKVETKAEPKVRKDPTTGKFVSVKNKPPEAPKTQVTAAELQPKPAPKAEPKVETPKKLTKAQTKAFEAKKDKLSDKMQAVHDKLSKKEKPSQQELRTLMDDIKDIGAKKIKSDSPVGKALKKAFPDELGPDEDGDFLIKR